MKHHYIRSFPVSRMKRVYIFFLGVQKFIYYCPVYMKCFLRGNNICIYHKISLNLIWMLSITVIVYVASYI